MKLTTEDIQKEIDDHKESLMEYDEQYRPEFDFPGNEDKTIVELIEDCDWESPDFNIGFEQGYIRGMEVLLALSKETVI